MTLNCITRLSYRKARGFSLTEFAVVLAAGGLIMGAIWSMVRAVWEYQEREKAVEEVATIVGNVRSYYTGQLGLPHLGDAAMTSQLIGLNVIPGSVQRGNTATCTNAGNLCADTPWGETYNNAIDGGGTLRVCDWNMGVSTSCPTANAAGYTPFFGVALRGLTTGACIAVAQKMATVGGAPGLVEVNINGTNLVKSGKGIDPMAAADTNTYCTAVASGSAIVTFVYRLTQASY